VEQVVERLAVEEENVTVLVLRLRPRVLLELPRRQHLRGAEKKSLRISAQKPQNRRSVPKRMDM